MESLESNVSLAPFSSFFVGGKADFFAKISTKDQLLQAFSFLSEKKIPFFVLGGGSNIVFSDNGFLGMVLKMENNAKKFLGNHQFWVESGTKNAELFPFALEQNADFSEFYTIPGSIGGAICGNAGLPSKEMKDFLVEAEIFDTQEQKFLTVSADFFQFSYRHSILSDENFAKRFVVWSCILHIPPSSTENIRNKAAEMLKKRKEKQPWGKTGGSFFKNPAEGAAGFFLEQVGMKGQKCGGAFFSEKHANFLMSDGTATQKNIVELAQMAQKKVKDQCGISLFPEVKILSEVGKRWTGE